MAFREGFNLLRRTTAPLPEDPRERSRQSNILLAQILAGFWGLTILGALGWVAWMR